MKKQNTPKNCFWQMRLTQIPNISLRYRFISVLLYTSRQKLTVNFRILRERVLWYIYKLFARFYQRTCGFVCL